jgi:phytoene desaturase
MKKRRIAVLGGGMGGLSAALYLGLDGHEVTLFEQRDRVGGKAAEISEGDYRLDPGPSIIILKEIYEKVLTRAGAPDLLRFRRLDPWSRILQEERDHPIDLSADQNACLETLGRAEPDDYAGLQQLFQAISKAAPALDDTVFARPIEKPWQLLSPGLVRFALNFNPRLTYRELVDRHLKSDLLRSFFYGFPSYSGQSFESKAPGALVIPYLMASKGVYFPEGGVRAIPAAFKLVAERIGVRFELGQRVTGLRPAGGRLVAAKTEAGDEIEADVFVSGIDRLTTEGLLGRRVDAKPSYSYFTLHLGLPRLLPDVLHHTLLVPRGASSGFSRLYGQYEPPRPAVVYLNNSTSLDPAAAPEGKTNLFVVLTVPAMHDHLDWDVLGQQLRDEAHQSLAKFGIDASDAEFERVQDPRTFEQRDGSYRGSLYGPDEKERLWGGLFPLSNRDAEFENLFYCGGSVQPGAGLPMATLGGKFVADIIARQ